MMKSILGSLVVLLSFGSAFAADGDLTLPGERWLAKFTAYVCEDGNTPTTSVPEQFAAMDVAFGRATTDFTLDNLLLKATFVEAGVSCNYSALIFADNAAKTAKLVQSKAYAPTGGDCVSGKMILDKALEFNAYKYLHGRGHLCSGIRCGFAMWCGRNDDWTSFPGSWENSVDLSKSE